MINKEKTCEICKNKFIPNKFHPKQKTCSRKCCSRLEFLNHKEQRLKKIYEWNKNNPEKVREYHRRYYHKYIEKNRIKSRTKHHKLSHNEFIELCKTHDYKCRLCNEKFEPKDLTIDHNIPTSKGGTHNIENLQPMCLKCNQIKGNRFTLDENNQQVPLC